MPLRKALAYSKRHVTAFTRRSRSVKHLNYIKAVPQQKIVKFNMGNLGKFNKGEFKQIISLIACESVQIRDMSLEATRQFLNNRIGKLLIDNYALFCKAYPHQVIRENKTFSGGSKGERVQSGMSHSFGTTMGRSAHVPKGKAIFIIAFSDKKDIISIRELCKSVSPKLPCKCKIVYEEKK